MLPELSQDNGSRYGMDGTSASNSRPKHRSALEPQGSELGYFCGPPSGCLSGQLKLVTTIRPYPHEVTKNRTYSLLMIACNL